MNPRCGAYVFLVSGRSVLLLFRQLTFRCLVVWYECGVARYGLATFSQLLDVVPIHAIPLPEMNFPLQPTLEHTAHTWLSHAYASLNRACAG